MHAAAKIILVCVLLVAGMLLITGTAEAHAHLVRADLAPDSDLTVPAGTVRFWFDEALNPALSKIVIKDAKGRQVNTDTGQINPGNSEELDVAIPALAAGQYSVFWTSDSAQDGHILHGFYVFTVGGRGAAAIGSTSGVVASGNSPPLDSAAWAGALAHWLVLLASTLWTGAAAFELLVLTPARRRARGSIAALADRASERAITILQLGLLAALLASLLEIEALAYASGSSILSLSTDRDLLRSHFGTYWLIRLLCIFLAQMALIMVPAPSPNRELEARPEIGARVHALMTSVAAIGLAYLLALAMSGHAAAVSQMVATSVLLDWLHLLANTLWIGGMAAIALALVPVFLASLRAGKGDGNDARLAFLVMLDQYSPVAFIAVPTAMVTGIFNAQVHLDSLDAFFNSEYGRFLIVKLALIFAIILISASHVFRSRPRLLAILAGRGSGSSSAGFPSLIRRLEIEPVLGAGVLLCVALMTQVALPVTVFSSSTQASAGAVSTPGVANAASTAPTPEIPKSIGSTQHKGLLDVSLTIDPAAIGHARLFVTVRERGKPVTDGQVRVKLSVPGDTSLGATFAETSPSNGGYSGAGDLVQNGTWQADVLVRTRDDPLEFRDVPFDFVVGPGGGFLPNGLDPSAVKIAISPGRLNAANTVTLSNLHVSAVRLLSQSPGMDMGAETQETRSLGEGRWTAANLYAPMEGRWSLTVQVQVSGVWVSVRQFVYQVPLSGRMRLL